MTTEKFPTTNTQVVPEAQPFLAKNFGGVSLPPAHPTRAIAPVGTVKQPQEHR